MPVQPEKQELMNFAELLADSGRKIFLDAINEYPQVEIKPDNSLVTNIDIAIETRLREMIENEYPDHGIIGEEFGNKNIDKNYVWLLDPIDGTHAFVAGIPVYGTLIGLARKGLPFLGIVDHPATNERWKCVKGDKTLKNGKEVRTRECDKLENAFLTNSNPDFFNITESKQFQKLRRTVQITQYGGSCYAYAVLASGRTDLAIDSEMSPVDIFACAAIIEGAGGKITDWEGSPITLSWFGQVLASGDQSLHDKALNLINNDV